MAVVFSSVHWEKHSSLLKHKHADVVGEADGFLFAFNLKFSDDRMNFSTFQRFNRENKKYFFSSFLHYVGLQKNFLAFSNERVGEEIRKWPRSFDATVDGMAISLSRKLG